MIRIQEHTNNKKQWQKEVQEIKRALPAFYVHIDSLFIRVTNFLAFIKINFVIKKKGWAELPPLKTNTYKKLKTTILRQEDLVAKLH